MKVTAGRRFRTDLSVRKSEKVNKQINHRFIALIDLFDYITTVEQVERFVNLFTYQLYFFTLNIYFIIHFYLSILNLFMILLTWKIS